MSLRCLLLLALGCDASAGGGEHADTGEPIPSGRGLPWLSVVPGYGHACGVRSNGRIYCWGDGVWRGESGEEFTDYVLTEIPDGVDFATVALPDHGWEGQRACGLNTAGEPLCWGPGDLSLRERYLAIELGDGCLFGLRVDGMLDCHTLRGEPCWGFSPVTGVVSHSVDETVVLYITDEGAMLGGSAEAEQTPALPVGPWSGIGGRGDGEWVCGIRPGGTIECFGDPDSDARGLDSPPERLVSEVCVPSGGGACALGLDGAPVCWGDVGATTY